MVDRQRTGASMLLTLLATTLVTPVTAAPLQLTDGAALDTRPRTAQTRFVWATSLRVRATPNGTVQTTLGIDESVEVLDAREGFSHVRTSRGAVGWVASEFLGTSSLRSGRAVSAALETLDMPVRVMWAERLVALHPQDPSALLILAQAYRLAGRESDALQVLTSASQRSGIAPAGIQGRGENGAWRLTSPATEVAEIGVGNPLDIHDPRTASRMTDVVVWVLPEQGAAVKGTLVEVGLGYTSDCPPASAVVAEVRADLPSGEQPIAWTLAAPPASWHASVDPVPPSVVTQVQSMFEPGWNRPVATVVRTADGYRARVVHYLGLGPATDPGMDDDERGERYQILDLARTADAFEIVSQTAYQGSPFMGGQAIDRPVVDRDVDGDGRVDRVSRSECSMAVWLDGAPTPSTTHNRCCGC